MAMGIYRALAASAVLLAGMAAARADHLHYQGFIDGKIAVVMELRSDADAKVVGTYQYAISGKDIDLSGKVAGGVLTLTETTGDEKTGTFALTRNDDGTVTGNWTSADGKRNLPVALVQIAETATLRAVRPGDYSVQTQYLVFPERNDFLKALNAKLEADATAEQAALVKEAIAGVRERPRDAHYEWETSNEQRVTFADASLVSIRTMGYSYTGGAHGNYGYSAQTYSSREGKMTGMAVGDLIDTTPSALKGLAKLCIRDLKAQGASSPDDLVFDAKHLPTVNVTRAGLQFTFDPYEVGAYAEGTYVVTVPWKAAAEFVPAGSPVRRLMGDAPATPAVTPRPVPAAGGSGEFPRPG